VAVEAGLPEALRPGRARWESIGNDFAVMGSGIMVAGRAKKTQYCSFGNITGLPIAMALLC
jgi:hypothetical protein